MKSKIVIKQSNERGINMRKIICLISVSLISFIVIMIGTDSSVIAEQKVTEDYSFDSNKLVNSNLKFEYNEENINDMTESSAQLSNRQLSSNRSTTRNCLSNGQLVRSCVERYTNSDGIIREYTERYRSLQSVYNIFDNKYTTKDDDIVSILPKELFFTEGQFYHVGKEYGFVIYTVKSETNTMKVKIDSSEEHYPFYKSDVLVFDITSTTPEKLSDDIEIDFGIVKLDVLFSYEYYSFDVYPQSRAKYFPRLDSRIDKVVTHYHNDYSAKLYLTDVEIIQNVMNIDKPNKGESNYNFKDDNGKFIKDSKCVYLGNKLNKYIEDELGQFAADVFMWTALGKIKWVGSTFELVGNIKDLHSYSNSLSTMISQQSEARSIYGRLQQKMDMISGEYDYTTMDGRIRFKQSTCENYNSDDKYGEGDTISSTFRVGTINDGRYNNNTRYSTTIKAAFGYDGSINITAPGVGIPYGDFLKIGESKDTFHIDYFYDLLEPEMKINKTEARKVNFTVTNPTYNSEDVEVTLITNGGTKQVSDSSKERRLKPGESINYTLSNLFPDTNYNIIVYFSGLSSRDILSNYKVIRTEKVPSLTSYQRPIIKQISRSTSSATFEVSNPNNRSLKLYFEKSDSTPDNYMMTIPAYGKRTFTLYGLNSNSTFYVYALFRDEDDFVVSTTSKYFARTSGRYYGYC